MSKLDNNQDNALVWTILFVEGCLIYLLPVMFVDANILRRLIPNELAAPKNVFTANFFINFAINLPDSSSGVYWETD